MSDGRTLREYEITVEEREIEKAANVASAFSGSTLVWIIPAVSFLAVFTIGRRIRKPPEGTELATYLALGIGIPNLGEGLGDRGCFCRW